MDAVKQHAEILSRTFVIVDEQTRLLDGPETEVPPVAESAPASPNFTQQMARLLGGNSSDNEAHSEPRVPLDDDQEEGQDESFTCNVVEVSAWPGNEEVNSMKNSFAMLEGEHRVIEAPLIPVREQFSFQFLSSYLKTLTLSAPPPRILQSSPDSTPIPLNLPYRCFARAAVSIDRLVLINSSSEVAPGTPFCLIQEVKTISLSARWYARNTPPFSLFAIHLRSAR
ncbi:hypothetical protein ACLB2K_041314 [Fragaria x ananassa]